MQDDVEGLTLDEEAAVEEDIVDGLGNIGIEEEFKNNEEEPESGAAFYDKDLFAQELGDLDEDVDFD